MKRIPKPSQKTDPWRRPVLIQVIRLPRERVAQDVRMLGQPLLGSAIKALCTFYHFINQFYRVTVYSDLLPCEAFLPVVETFTVCQRSLNRIIAITASLFLAALPYLAAVSYVRYA